jgi:hypothetical protein
MTMEMVILIGLSGSVINMNNKIIDMIFDTIKDKNFYNYDNDEELRNVEVKEYTNILGDKVIDVVLEHETYTITCFKSYADKEEI